jgi:hypothetical protein
MATCPLTSGYDYSTGCDVGPGGIKWVAFCETYNKNTFTAVAGVVTVFTLQAAKVFRKYIPRKNTAFFTDDYTKDPVSGAYSYKPTINLTTPSLSTPLRQEIQLLGKNPLMAITMDNQGVARLAGYDNVLDMITAPAGSGTTMQEGQKIVMTFQGEETIPMYEVTPGLLAALGL